MKIAEIIQIIENFAPLRWQESWDNSGMQVGDPNQEATAALLTLDVTMDSVELARQMGANLIISHHPLIFSGLKSITVATQVGQIVIEAIKHGITIYACHTNMDSAPRGINWRLASDLNLSDIKVLESIPGESEVGMGRIGTIETTASELIRNVQEKFNLSVVRTNNFCDRAIRRIALCGGSGGSLIDAAISSGADAYVTGDLKYHDFQKAGDKLLLIDIGHYEGEIAVLEIFQSIIKEKFPIFALHLQKFNFIQCQANSAQM